MNLDLYNSAISSVQREFDDFKRYYRSLFTSSDADMSLLLDSLSKRNGKMLRPLLVLLIAKYFGYSSEEILHVASSVELLHTSSLIHDDVVDNSSLRRGLPSFNAVFDNKVSVLHVYFSKPQYIFIISRKTCFHVRTLADAFFR